MKIKALPGLDSDDHGAKAAFFALASRIMSRLWIHHSRPLAARAISVELDPRLAPSKMDSLAGIEFILSRLENIRPRLRSIVELKAFEGMTLEEIAKHTGCSTATVAREWRFAKHLLAPSFE